jgi:hypothetical protein
MFLGVCVGVCEFVQIRPQQQQQQQQQPVVAAVVAAATDNNKNTVSISI